MKHKNKMKLHGIKNISWKFKNFNKLNNYLKLKLNHYKMKVMINKHN